MSHGDSSGSGVVHLPENLTERLLMSPRANLQRVLCEAHGSSALPAGLWQTSRQQLQLADAENKLGRRKLYLVLDLDETLLHTQKIKEVGAVRRGTPIHLRGEVFDVMLRPGLEGFLSAASQDYVIHMYTMGDEAYVKAVLDLIDPDGKFFTGEQIFTGHPCMPPSLYTAYIQPAPYQLHTISNRALYDDPFRYTRIHLQSYKQVSIASERAHKYSHVCI